MSVRRLVYRGEQFRRHLGSRVTAAGLAEVRSLLTPAQMDLFLKMQPGEQAHSLAILQRLWEHGEPTRDLQVAALLHDVGKIRYPLSVWERGWIVLAKKLLPGRFKAWGAAVEEWESLPWWQRLCAVAERHPAWGAELAQAAGCSELTVSLIRRHQEKLLDRLVDEDRLLATLQAVDDQS